jgi:hypothetical protein
MKIKVTSLVITKNINKYGKLIILPLKEPLYKFVISPSEKMKEFFKANRSYPYIFTKG